MEDIRGRYPNANTTMAAMRTIFTNESASVVCQLENESPSHSGDIGYYNNCIIRGMAKRKRTTVKLFNQSTKEAFQKATLERNSLTNISQKFFQSYRFTLDITSRVSPHAAMYGDNSSATFNTDRPRSKP